MARPPVPGQRPRPPAPGVGAVGLAPAQRWPWLLALLALLALVAWRCAPREPATLGPVPPPTGQRTANVIDLCLAIDDSSSTGETDPANRRYQAARFLAGFLAQQSRPARPDRVCVVHFGGDAPEELALPLTPVTDRAAIDAAIATPTDLGDTNFVAADERLAELLGSPLPGHHQVVITFTDGVPSSSGSSDSFDAISRSLDNLPRRSTHLIALDENGAFDSVRSEWESLGLGSIRELSGLQGNELEHAFAHIVVDELGMQWGS